MATSLNTYELTFIVNAVLNEDLIKEHVKRVVSSVKESGGEIIEVDEWGSRRLAYPIRKKRNGHYVNVYFLAHGSSIQRMERAMEIDENILRYLTIRMDAKMLRHYENQKSVRAALKEEAEKAEA